MCSTVSRIRTPFSSLKSNLGNIANLDTSVKTSIVDAINAAQADIDDAKAGLGILDEKVDSVVGTLTPEIKAALLNCFAHVGWDHGGDKSYYDALEEALYADNVTRVEAVLSLGTHEVYNTDSIEALRNFLTVTAYFGDNTNEVVDTYTLEGDLSEVGTNTVTVKYGRSKRTTISVPTVENPSGILYEWDFTKGLIDLRQGKEATLGTGEPSLSYAGTVAPTRNNTGVVFNNKAQFIELFDLDYNVKANLYNKTIQVNISNFSYAPESSYNCGLIIFSDKDQSWNMSGMKRFSDGFAYKKNTGWSFYSGATWKSSIYTGMSDVNAISNRKISAYIDTNGKMKIYVDGISKGISDNGFAHNIYGLHIGDGRPYTDGGSFYNGTITSVRIYNGEVAQ